MLLCLCTYLLFAGQFKCILECPNFRNICNVDHFRLLFTWRVWQNLLCLTSPFPRLIADLCSVTNFVNWGEKQQKTCFAGANFVQIQSLSRAFQQQGPTQHWPMANQILNMPIAVTNCHNVLQACLFQSTGQCRHVCSCLFVKWSVNEWQP